MIDVRLSREIEVGAKAKPRYATDIIPTEGGFEFRNERWRYPKFSFEFNLEPGDPYDETGEAMGHQTLRELIELWHCAGGMAETFRFRHWSDWRGRGENIGTGDGVTEDFQLYRVYQTGLVTRLRKITRPAEGSVVAYVNGVVTAVTVDSDTGIISFAAAPAAGTQITADFDFDLPVRFDDDELELVALTGVLDQPTNIVLVEVRERAA